MKKIIVFLLIILSFPVYADNININSQNAIVINLNDNNVLYEKNSEEQVYIASLTKIATAIVAIEKIDNLEETVTITEEMLSGIYEYSKAGLKVGDVVTYKDLLYGVILPSGADCVQALEIMVSGNRENFAQLMNDLVKKLELEKTHFSNGIGMDENNYSSVKDVAKILDYALKNELFFKIYTTKQYTMSNGLEVTATIEHHNLDTKIIKGSKTGFTDAAGLCISAIYEDEIYKYLVVTTNANYTDGFAYHIMDAITLINYYLDNYHYVTIYNKNDIITSISVLEGKQDNYDIKASEQLKLYLKKDINQTNLKFDIKHLKNLDKNNKKGDYLGSLNIKYNEKILYTKDLFLEKTLTFKQDINPILIIILIVFIIFLLIYNILLRKKIHRLIIKLKSK